MHILKLLLLVSFTFTSFWTHAQIEVLKFNTLESKMEIMAQNNELSIVNFWATWCKPCIAELPYFEEAGKAFAEKGVTLLLVSMDFVEVLDSKVKPFVQKRNMQSSVVLLDETDYNAFINEVDKNWSGAIPATLFIGKNGKRKVFFEKEFQRDDLFDEIEDFLNSKSGNATITSDVN